MKIVILNGKGAVGKDTFVKMVTEISAARNYNIQKISTIDYVKELATLAGWNGGKTLEDRKFLSDFKDILTKWKDIPYNKVKEKIKNISCDMLFVDCREPKEIERFVKDYHALTVLVQRPTIQIYGNHADDNVENYDYDVIIDNSRGLDELFQEATIFVETFVEGD